MDVASTASYREKMNGQVSVDIYLYLEYGVAVPSIAQPFKKKAVKSADL